MNLVSNAFKFTDAGSVTVTARCEAVASQSDAVDESATADSATTKRWNKSVRWTSLSAGDDSNSGWCCRDSRRRVRETISNAVKGRCLGTGRSAQLENERVPGASPAFLRSLEAPEYGTRMLVVEVQDTGVGMSTEQMNRIFTPFSQVLARGARCRTSSLFFSPLGRDIRILCQLGVVAGGDLMLVIMCWTCAACPRKVCVQPHNPSRVAPLPHAVLLPLVLLLGSSRFA